jgi:hypothetical protein
MRKGILILSLCAVLAITLAYTAHGQSKEQLDKFKEAERLIELLKKTNEAIEIIEKDRKLPAKLEVFDVADLIEENRIKDYAPPSPFVFNVESATAEEGEIDTESFEELYGPEEVIELVKATTGEENWPEEEGGMGTVEYHRGKLIVINTPEMIDKVEALLDGLKKSLPAVISSTVYLLAVDEDYLKQHRRTGSSVITPQAVEKMLDDSQAGKKIELLKTGYITSYSSQAAYIHSGALHTYIGNTDTSGAGGLTPVLVFDPVINVFREGFIIGLRAQYNRRTNRVNLVAMVSLSKLTVIEEHTGIGGSIGKQAPQKCKVETPKVDLQIVSGSSDIPVGYGLLLGGSRMKTAQAEQKSFIVLIVPVVQK